MDVQLAIAAPRLSFVEPDVTGVDEAGGARHLAQQERGESRAGPGWHLRIGREAGVEGEGVGGILAGEPLAS